MADYSSIQQGIWMPEPFNDANSFGICNACLRVQPQSLNPPQELVDQRCALDSACRNRLAASAGRLEQTSLVAAALLAASLLERS